MGCHFCQDEAFAIVGGRTMMGVRKGDEKKILARRQWLRELFLGDCRKRQGNGFVDPPLSGPQAQKLFHEKYGTSMNSQRMYQFRDKIFAEFGLTKEGRPIRGKRQGLQEDGAQLQQAARDPQDPLFNVAVVPVGSREHGELLAKSLAVLAEKGLVEPSLRVDDVHDNYVTVTRYPKAS